MKKSAQAAPAQSRAKRVGIYFSAPNFDDAPFTNADYRQSYHDLAAIITERGGQCILVRGEQTFQGAGTFSHGWVYEYGVFRKTDGPVQLDIIYNKGEAFAADEATVLVNDPHVDALCRNKERTIQQFPQYFPASTVVNSVADIPAALSKLNGETIVAKPTDGWGGQGVFVGPRGEVHQKLQKYPALLQEFIDTSKGIPGIVEGTHDFRILIVGGTVALCYVRTPPDGTVVANVAQGGSIILVPEENIPAEALAIAMDIDREIGKAGKRVYSVDFGFHQQREWKLFELNPQPGLTSMKWGDGVRRYYELLAEELLK